MKYRPEIDGLRSVAVLIVLIFHIDPRIIPGGFIGVDIFFVISGFLITSIISKSLEENNFSYKEFYTKRIKRLLPLFFAVVVFTLISGYFILFPADFRVLAGDVLAANLFLANVKSAFGSNYFESEQPLLHFWSLAVEEQFYFVMPTILFLLYKYLRKYTKLVLIVIFLISLGLAEFMSATPKFAQMSYFLLPTRAWELIAGCLLALSNFNMNARKSTILSIIGGVLIIISAFTINEQSVFPGFITLLPVIGSLLIIIGREHGFGKLLKLKPFLFVGLASYSIYMWHWPIIIFLKSVFRIEEFSIFQTLLLSLAIIVIGYFSQKFIEDFFRFMKNINFSKALTYYFVLPFVLTAGFSYYVYSNNGIPNRYGVDAIYTTTATKKCSSLDVGCFITESKDENNKVVMIGDSHADHFSNLFSKWFDENNISLRLFASGGCNFYSDKFYTSVCEDVKTRIKQNIENANTIIIAKRLDEQFTDQEFVNEFESYISNLTKKGKSVVFIKQIPKFTDTSNFLGDWMNSKRYGTHFNYENNFIDSIYEKGNNKIVNQFISNENVHILDFNKILLIDGVYKKFSEEKMPIYYDSDHLTAYGAEWLYEKIKIDRSFDWVLNLINENFSK